MVEIDFNWGKSNEWFINTVSAEIFENKLYEKLVKVEKNDVVVDIGASVGPFAYSIGDKEPSHVYCFEPSPQEFETLEDNLSHLHFPSTAINKGISNVTGTSEFEIWGTFEGAGQQQFEMGEAESIKFSDFIKEYDIDHIEFLKTDCEG